MDDGWSDDNIGSIGSDQWSDSDIGGGYGGLQSGSFRFSSDDDDDDDIEGVIIDCDNGDHEAIENTGTPGRGTSASNQGSGAAPTAEKRKSLATRIRRNRDAIRKLGMTRPGQGVEGSVVLNFERRHSSIRDEQDQEQAKLERHIAATAALHEQGGSGEGGEKVGRVVPIRRLISREESMRRGLDGNDARSKF